MNAGEITKATRTTVIHGRLGMEYENYKSYSDYCRNGFEAIELQQLGWEDLWRGAGVGGQPSGWLRQEVGVLPYFPTRLCGLGICQSVL